MQLEGDMQEIVDIFDGGEDNRILIAESILGEDAAEWVKSDLGTYVIGRANQEIKEATDSLKKTLPWRWRRIQHLQNRIRIAESVKGWLIEAIATGRTALAELDRRHTTGEE